jgi:hypothetical protein
VRAIVTLTSDFGLRDSYVAEMKGVILAIAGDLRLVDITHEIARHDIGEGAFVLEGATAHFPPGTVHLAVVDPGVGSARRGLVVCSRGVVLVGPDNGLFTSFLEGEGWQAFELTAPEFRRQTVSRTFHGRDVFAPAAAHIALGVSPSRLGPPVPDPVRLPWPAARAGDDGVEGAVVHVDRFGNLVTSIRAAAVAGLGAGASAHVGGRPLPVVGTYADLEVGCPGALVGSHGRLEIAVREGSAEALLRAGRGTPVRLTSARAGSEASPDR